MPPQNTEVFLSKNANEEKGPDRWTPITEATVTGLAAKSTERVAKEPKFAEIKKEIEETNKNRGIVKLAELRKKAKKGSPERDKEDDRYKALDAVVVTEAVNIAADLVAAHGKQVAAAAATR